MTLTIRNAILVSLLASPALGDCPRTPADVATGVYLSFGDFYTQYMVLPDGQIQETESYPDGNGTRFVSIDGVFVTRSIDMRHGVEVPGTEGTVQYLIDPDLLPAIRPNLNWRTPTIRREEGGAPMQEPMSIEIGPAFTYSIGPCSFTGYEIVQRTFGEDGNVFVDELTYLAELGVSVYHGGADQSEVVDRAEPVEISTELTPAMANIIVGETPVWKD